MPLWAAMGCRCDESLVASYAFSDSGDTDGRGNKLRQIATGLVAFIAATLALIPLSTVFATGSGERSAVLGLVHLVLWAVIWWAIARRLADTRSQPSGSKNGFGSIATTTSTLETAQGVADKSTWRSRSEIALTVVVLVGLVLVWLSSGGGGQEPLVVDATSDAPSASTSTPTTKSAPTTTAESTPSGNTTILTTTTEFVSAAEQSERNVLAVDVVRAMTLRFDGLEDHEVLSLIEETASTLNLASLADRPTDETAFRLFERVRNANALSIADHTQLLADELSGGDGASTAGRTSYYDIQVVFALVEGAIVSYGSRDHGSVYGLAILNWFRNEGTVTLWGTMPTLRQGLVSYTPECPTGDPRFLPRWMRHSERPTPVRSIVVRSHGASRLGGHGLLLFRVRAEFEDGVYRAPAHQPCYERHEAEELEDSSDRPFNYSAPSEIEQNDAKDISNTNESPKWIQDSSDFGRETPTSHRTENGLTLT